MTPNEENSRKTGHMLKDPHVSTGLSSRSIRSVRRGEIEAKRIFKVSAQKTMRNRVLTENMKQERMLLFFKAPVWQMDRTGQQLVNKTTRLLGLVAMQ